MKREAKWVEVRHNKNYMWDKRIKLDVNNDGSCLCVVQGCSDTYLNGGKYDTYTWNEYREIKKPVYKPYKELTEEVRNKLRGAWVKSNNGNNESEITGFVLRDDKVELGDCHVSLNGLFDYWTFLNGDTIGELEN